MGRIRVIHAHERVSMSGEEIITGSRRAAFSDAELRARLSFYFPTGGERLTLFETSYEPGTLVQPHGHDVDEVIVVSQGSLRAGSHTLVPGSALYVEAMTLYGFEVGPEGCTLLNFRPERGSILTKEELLAQRRHRKGTD